jgi:hypothetical protein
MLATSPAMLQQLGRFLAAVIGSSLLAVLVRNKAWDNGPD